MKISTTENDTCVVKHTHIDVKQLWFNDTRFGKMLAAKKPIALYKGKNCLYCIFSLCCFRTTTRLFIKLQESQVMNLKWRNVWRVICFNVSWNNFMEKHSIPLTKNIFNCSCVIIRNGSLALVTIYFLSIMSLFLFY